MKENKLFTLITYLSIFGITLAIYLLWQQVFQPSFRPCNISASINCDAVISGPVAKTFGISTPLFGLVGYSGIFIASLLKKRRTVLGIAVFGLGFCLWIAYKELFELKVICPICVICQLIMITIFSLSVKINIRIKKKI